MGTRIDQLGNTLFLHTRPCYGLRIFGGLMGAMLLLFFVGFLYLMLGASWRYQFDIIRNKDTYLDVRYRHWILLGLFPVEDRLLVGVRRIEAKHEGPAGNPVIEFQTTNGPELLALPMRWKYFHMETASELHKLVRQGGSPSYTHSAEFNGDFFGMSFLNALWFGSSLVFLYMTFGRSFLVADRSRRIIVHERRFLGLSWKRSITFDAILSIEDKWRKVRSRGSEVTDRLIEIHRTGGKPWRILVEADHQDDVRIMAARIHNFVRGF